LLGTFLLGVFFKKTKLLHATIGFICGLLVMVYVIYFTKIAWTWYTIIGVAVTLLAANMAVLFTRKQTINNQQ